MIDLTKPVRIKDERTPVVVQPVGRYVVTWPDGYVHYFSSEELERLLENVPEPRKPREWWFNLYSDGFFGLQNNSIEEAKANVLKGRSAEHIRVIEWPGGAPLPDWPEDGG